MEEEGVAPPCDRPLLGPWNPPAPPPLPQVEYNSDGH